MADTSKDISDYFMTAAERRESVANDVILNPMSSFSLSVIGNDSYIHFLQAKSQGNGPKPH